MANNSQIDRNIVTYPRYINKSIVDNLVESLKAKFPIETSKYIVELKNLNVPENIELSPKQFKESVLKKTTVGIPITGIIVVKDKSTGKVVNESKKVLLRAPILTDHFSFIIDGTEYTLPNQLRIREGVYTRFRANKNPEATFNLSKGKNFDIVLDPKTNIYNIEFSSGGKVPLYPVLEALGISKEEIAKRLGKAIAESNATEFSDKEKENAIKKFLEITGASSVKDFFENTGLDPNVTELTLGKRYEKVTPETILDASEKLLKLTRGEVEPDNRDKLAFKRLLTPEDILAEALDKRSKPILNKIKQKVDKEGKFPDGVNFNKAVHKFLATSQLAQNPEQINPLESLDKMTRVTFLGEGGISSTQAIPLESRNVQDSHLGFIDLIRTSESQKAGVDLRLTIGSAKGKDGYIYAPFFNVKTKKIEYLNPLDIEKHVVATPDYFENKDSNEIPALKNGKLTKVKRSEVEYALPHGNFMFSPITGALPFLNNNSGNRVNMGSKFLTQALPLEHREEPLVQTKIPLKDMTYQKILSNYTDVLSPATGKVTKIDDEFIYIKDNSGKTHKVPYYNNYPLSRKTMLHQEPLVKVGDTIKEGDKLVDSNFSKNGTIALGTHLNAVYVPYKGYNHEDGIVVSESAAKKLTSLHMYKHFHEITKDHILGKNKFKAQYPTEFTSEQLDKLDEDGVVKPGTIIKKGDPIIAALVKKEPTQEELMLGKLSKTFIRPLKKYTETWDKDVEGEVVDVKKSDNKVMVTIKTKEQAVVGDKLAIQHGGKGVITKILPDEQMPKVNGQPADIILTPLGILSRTNPGQIYEIIHNKVAQKLGKPIVVENFSGEDAWKKTKELMNKHGVSDTEEVEFPENGKKVKALAGPIYTMKLFKQTETNYAARDFGEYDSDERPIKGGEEGAKSIGMLDMYAYISHGAHKNLQEMSVYKGTKNDDFWNAVMTGKPIPAPKPSFTTTKFLNMLKAAGINVVEEKDGLRLLPMTDKDIEKISNGEIKEPKKIDYKFEPEEGGLFDPIVLGGMSGDRWGHISLPTKIVNPVYEGAVKALLGKDVKMYGDETYKALKNINVDEEFEKTKKALDSATNASERDKLRKKLKALFNLKKQGFSNPAEAYMLSKVPVLPPKYRPIIVDNNGLVLSHNANYLYTDVLLQNKGIQEAKKLGVPDEALESDYETLYNNVKTLFGLADPTNVELRAKNVQGFIAMATGKNKQPKESYFQGKVIKKTQDLSARATAVTDASLGIDEIGIPIDMGLTLYKPFIVKEMTNMGYKVPDILEMIQNKDPKVLEVLNKVSQDRPVIANRAPTLWKHNIMAFKPKFVEGKSVVANGLILPGFNLDFDGDTMQIYVPVTEEARKEAIEKLMPSKIPFNIQTRDMMFYPRQEALMGLYNASKSND